MSLSVVEFRSPIGLIVTRPAVGVISSDTLGQAGQMMRRENVSALLVDDGQAILSERDMARALAAGHHPEDPVALVASTEPITVGSETLIVDAAALMLNQNIRHLVIRFPDGESGVVSMRAVLAVLLQAANPELWLKHLRLNVRLNTSDLWLG